MKITYLGTAAAEGIPAVFCNCEVCRRARKLGGKNIRTRAQIVIDGELSVDFPPDAYVHSVLHGVDLSAVKYLLVTHAHMDHFYASDFVVRGGCFAYDMASPTLDLYANAETLEIYREQTRREQHKEIGDAVILHEIKPFDKLAFGDYRVLALPACHSSRDPMLFSIEKGGKRVLHLHDSGPIPGPAWEALREEGGHFDLIDFDCTFLFHETYAGARHMGLDENMRTLQALVRLGLADERTKKVVTHFSHNSAPTEEALARAEREYGVIAAYDGMTLEI